jgi:protein involved in polysaccharide export with SLBB domain
MKQWFSDAREAGKGALATCLSLLCVICFSGCQPATHTVRYADLSPVDGAEPVNRPASFSRVNMTNRVLRADWLKPPANRFTLGPGDRVEIESIGDPTSRTDTVVGPDGKIYFNLLPGIDVWGATLPETRAKLEHELGKYTRERPQISVILRGVESKRVWILGRVQAPGVYSLTAPMTLLEALSMAGGTMTLSNFQDQEAAGIGEELADLSRAFVVRDSHPLPVDFDRLLNHGDMSQNVYLQPDDFVYIPGATAREVYVLGAVAQPRPVSYIDGMGVAAAIASAYGTIEGAYMHHVLVIRGSLNEPDVAVIDYRNLINGKAPDLALKPHDIVYVPFSPYRYLQKYVELAVNTFASAAAINAGVKAIAPKQQGQAGVFIPVGSGVSIVPPVNPPPIQ